MAAIRFKARFVEPIQLGAKRQTIRATEPKGFRLGAWAPLYTGARMKPVFFGSVKMFCAWPIRIDRDNATISTAIWTLKTRDKLDTFARADGFADWRDMETFWDENHSGVRQFEGVLMSWSEFTTDYRLGAAA